MSKAQSTEIQVVKMDTGMVHFHVVGTTPVILNRMTEKGMRELLLPKGRKTAADKATSLKHDPMQEFRASPYTSRDPKSPTYLLALAVWFKKGCASAALDIPGVAKAKIDRMLWGIGDQCKEERISLYGVPQMMMAITRSADQNATPDVRSRVIIPRWACTVSIKYPKPQLNDVAVTNLLVAAGMLSGIGDWRNEKGSGRYGCYEVVGPDNKEFDDIVKNGGRQAQLDAMEHPEFYDQESEELYRWFEEEVKARGKHDLLSDASKSNGKASRKRATSAV